MVKREVRIGRYLLPETFVDDELLADAKGVNQSCSSVLTPIHSLFQLVKAPRLQGNANCLLKSAVFVAPAAWTCILVHTQKSLGGFCKPLEACAIQ